MSLSKLTIGPFDPLRNERNLVHVDNSTTCTTPGALYDKEMGIVKKPGWPTCTGDYAACFGTTGFIVLPTPMLNPGFEDEMCKFLALFTLEDTPGQPFRLRMLDIIPNLAEKFKSKGGFRKLKAISKAAVSANPWRPWEEGGGVKYKYKEVGPEGRKIDAWKEIHGSTLRDMLRDVCERHIAGEPRYDPVRTLVTLNDLGFNVSISRPDQFVVDVVPVMQNSMRAPLMGSMLQSDCVTTKVHPLTTYYHDLVDATMTRNIMNIRIAWMAILETDEQYSMKKTVFTGSKEAFLRGSMFSKVGGQIARSVVAPNPLQRPDQVGIPRLFAKDISRRVAVTSENVDEISRLIQDGHITHIMYSDTHEYIKIGAYSSIDLIPGKMLVLRELADGDIVIINRQPTLHKNSLLAFRVYLHDDDVIYIHPSATTSFGMDFDGDEGNAIFPYTPIGIKEAEDLIFVTWNMASMASSTLIVGYHQDVCLAAHMMSFYGCYMDQYMWEDLAREVYNLMWKDPVVGPALTWDQWLRDHEDRCKKVGIDLYSGRSLYSTMLPSTMQWNGTRTMAIENGILRLGPHDALDASKLSKSSGSIGMVMYSTYQPEVTVSWLNASYHMLNRYLAKVGITLAFPHLLLSDVQNRDIAAIKRTVNTRLDLQDAGDNIHDPVLKTRHETRILQELNNARETVAVMVMRPRDPSIATRVRGPVSGILSLTHRAADVPEVRMEISKGSRIDADFYHGSITLHAEGSPSITWSMGDYPDVSFDIEVSDGIRKSIESVSRTWSIDLYPLRMMTESGARGNTTNAIQIAGIIGQQSYKGQRIPRLMGYGEAKGTRGIRSFPTVPFGSNTPESRGFISNSYLQGMTPTEYGAAQQAARENLVSNVSLTPETGYFERRAKTFTENLKISLVDGKRVVTNERDIVVMWDYLLDTSRVFNVGGVRTFVDIRFEMGRNRASIRHTKAIFFRIDALSTLDAYISVDQRLHEVSSDDNRKEHDVIVAYDTKMQRDFVEYLYMLKNRGIINILVAQGSVHPIDMYEYTLVVDATHGMPSMPSGTWTSAINVSQPSISGPSYPSKKGEQISESILYQMMVYGSAIEAHPYVVRPSRTITTGSLLERMILAGPIIAL